MVQITKAKAIKGRVLSKNAKLRVIGYVIMLFHVCLMLAALCIITFVTYLASCFITNKAPFKADFKVSPTVMQGGTIEATWFNAERMKVCSYRRNFAVVANNHHWTEDEVASTPAYAKIGTINDINYSVDLPESLPPGPATFFAIIRYSCPGNIVQYFNPYTIVWSQQFTILGKDDPAAIIREMTK